MPNTSDNPTAGNDESTTSGQTSEHDTPSGGHNNTGAKKEIGGRDGPDPTRYGDWERAGRCIDF